MMINRFRTWLFHQVTRFALFIEPQEKQYLSCRWGGCETKIGEHWRRPVGFCSKHMKQGYKLKYWNLENIDYKLLKNPGWRRYTRLFVPREDLIQFLGKDYISVGRYISGFQSKLPRYEVDRSLDHDDHP